MSQPPAEQQPYTGGGAGGSGISPRMIVGAVIAVLAVIFVLQNTEKVEISFLFFSFSAPLWLVLVLMALLGALLANVGVNAWRKARAKSKE